MSHRFALTKKEIIVQVQPYVFFDGRCEEAIEFYRKALGASVTMMMRFKDSPDPAACGPIDGNKVMHAQFLVGETTILASDGRSENKPEFEGFSLSLTVSTVDEAIKFFNALGDGGKVQMPLGKTFFSPQFGMVADRFGVIWMVYVKPS